MPVAPPQHSPAHNVKQPGGRRVEPQGVRTHRSEQQQGSGGTQVPCLKITDSNGQTRWLKESSAIVAYLRERFAA